MGVILLLQAGESNLVSRAVYDGSDLIVTPTGSYWYKASTNTLESNFYPTGEGNHSGAYSMNPKLVKRLKDLTGLDTIIVPVAVGATTIGAWSRETGGLYNEAKSAWNAAIAYCAANNITIENKYIHWLQGGNDAGSMETDGYYVALNEIVNDFMNDFPGVEKVLGTRIGYDPNYTANENCEKIMRAQKLVNFNNPNFIMISHSAPTFTFANGKMQGDLVHFSLSGQNELAEDLAVGLTYHKTFGEKISLSETVSSLQSVTNGTINLTNVLDLRFNNSVIDNRGNFTASYFNRDGYTLVPESYLDGGIVIPLHHGVKLSRHFSSSEFTLEIKLKITKTSGTNVVLGNSVGGASNKLIIEYNHAAQSADISFSTNDGLQSYRQITSIDFTQYHKLKFVQNGTTIKFYLDNVLIDTNNSTQPFKVQYLGTGHDHSPYDFEGVVDYLTIRNSATPLYSVYYGDSIMFGNELGGQQYTHRWPSKYTTLHGGVPYTDDYNGALSGWTLINTYGGNGAYEDISDTVSAYTSTVGFFFLGYGVNDYFRGKASSHTISQIINDYVPKLRSEIQKLKSVKNYPADKIVLVWNYLVDNAPYNALRSEWVQLKSAAKAVAESEGILICDFDTAIDVRSDKGNYSDGDLIHPNASYNIIMAEMVDDILTTSAGVDSNISPTVNAGVDQSIQLPISEVTLSGTATDSDGNIATYTWSKVSGPSGSSITTPSSYTTTVTGLTAGVYVFRLSATDNLGTLGYDDVQVTVTASNVFPTVSAGTDQEITLPVSSVTLTGTVNDSDGSIASHVWSKQSGPSGEVISSTTSLSTQVTFSTAGTYIFRLAVTDNQGATAYDEVQVIVHDVLPPVIVYGRIAVFS